MASISKQPKFARIWRGRTVTAKADEYQRYLLQNGIAPLEAKGALGVADAARGSRRPKPSSSRSPIGRASRP